MAAISLSLPRGVDGFNISDFTVGTLAPNAATVELRFNTTDGAANVTMKDVLKAMIAFTRAIETSGNPNTRVFTIPTL